MTILKIKKKYHNKCLLHSLLIIGLISCGNITEKKSKPDEVKIQWIDDLSGDFSFKDNWSYPEGIFRNAFGQLSCDGICPPEIISMMNENGQIYSDSLEAFYNLVDTTHLFHSIESESEAYEWVGTDFISVEKKDKDTIICITENNSATHSSLNLIIVGDFVKPTIVLESINFMNKTMIYNCQEGEMLIDKNLWQKGILKASFDFKFEDKESPDKSMRWKGKIYKDIEIEK